MDINEELNLIIQRLKDKDPSIQKAALTMLQDIVKGTRKLTPSTSQNYIMLDSNRHFLEEEVKNLEGDNLKMLCDILSVMSVGNNGALQYRMQGGIIALDEWGQNYVKRLSSSIVENYGRESLFEETGEDVSLMMVKGMEAEIPQGTVATDCVRFFFRHNAECEAIDFMHELMWIDRVHEYVDEHNYERVALYLTELIKMQESKGDREALMRIHRKMQNYPALLVTMLAYNETQQAIQLVRELRPSSLKLQLCLMLGRCNVFYRDEEYASVLSNTHIANTFLHVTEDLQIREPKKAEEFIKGNIKYDLKNAVPLSISNAYVHFGFKKDALRDMLSNPELERGKVELISIYANLGVIGAWDLNGCFDELSEFMFSNEGYKRSGVLMGMAVGCGKIVDENHALLALLVDNMKGNCPYQKIASALGIESIYSCSINSLGNTDGLDEHRLRMKEAVTPLIFSDNTEVSCFAAFAMGSIFASTADEEVLGLLIQNYLDKSVDESPFLKFNVLGIALLFLKMGESALMNGVLETLNGINRWASMLVRGVAFIGSGETAVIEDVLSELFNYELKEKDADFDVMTTSMGLLSAAMISMGDPLATKMCLRLVTSSSLLESAAIKTAIPLCISLLYASNPDVEVVDVLSRGINTLDPLCLLNTIYAMGMIGAGTNNTRIAQVLEQQYSYHPKNNKASFMLKLSQGLLHLGKGTLSLNPFVYKGVMLHKNVIGLLSMAVLLSEGDNMIFKYPFLSYLLGQSVIPKYVVCMDKSMDLKKVGIRVGMPVNVVGMVGKPRKLSNVQTHTSPVIVQTVESAEMCEDEIVSSYVEDVVIVV